MRGSKIAMLIAAITNAPSSRENIAMATVCATAQTFGAGSPKLCFPCGLLDAIECRGYEASRFRVTRQFEIPLRAAVLRHVPPNPTYTCTNNKRRS